MELFSFSKNMWIEDYISSLSSGFSIVLCVTFVLKECLMICLGFIFTQLNYFVASVKCWFFPYILYIHVHREIVLSCPSRVWCFAKGLGSFYWLFFHSDMGHKSNTACLTTKWYVSWMQFSRRKAEERSKYFITFVFLATGALLTIIELNTTLF
jgi:hypothetical protein